ncbi:hypothetical protein M5E87_21430 [Flavonifractor plautii]|nr:hypothetical protein M5E87_21430 [Flavonifractor plautii]
MSKYIAVITRADITRAALVEAGGGLWSRSRPPAGASISSTPGFMTQSPGGPSATSRLMARSRRTPDGTARALPGTRARTSAWI